MEPCTFQPKTEKIFFLILQETNPPPPSQPKNIYIYIFYILGDRTFESKA